MIRLTLYGISGRVQATYDLKPGEQLDVEHRPVFTVTRIVAEPVQEQLEMSASPFEPCAVEDYG